MGNEILAYPWCQIKPLASQSDKDFLKFYDLEKLKEMGFDGVIERLKNSGIIQ